MAASGRADRSQWAATGGSFAVTRDRLVAVASEAGAVPFEASGDDPSRPARTGRDPRSWTRTAARSARTRTPSLGAAAAADPLTSRGPSTRMRPRRRLRPPCWPSASSHAERYLAGVDAERARLDIKTMTLEAHEPLWSMGDDTPTAGRGRLDRPVADHLRQAFAQVTNPAIDPERERIGWTCGPRSRAARRCFGTTCAGHGPFAWNVRSWRTSMASSGPCDGAARGSARSMPPGRLQDGPVGLESALRRLGRRCPGGGRVRRRGPRPDRRRALDRPPPRPLDPGRRRRAHGAHRGRPARSHRHRRGRSRHPRRACDGHGPGRGRHGSASPPGHRTRDGTGGDPRGGVHVAGRGHREPGGRVRGGPAQDARPDGHQRGRKLHRWSAGRHRRPGARGRRTLLPDRGRVAGSGHVRGPGGPGPASTRSRAGPAADPGRT